MKIRILNFLMGTAMLVVVDGLSGQVPVRRPAITNTVRVIRPPLLNSNRATRVTPGQFAPAHSQPRGATPFVNSTADMAPLPSAATSLPAAAPSASPATVPNPGSAKPSVPVPATLPTPTPKSSSPAIAAPAARRPAPGEVIGKKKAQTAAEALADVQSKLAAQVNRGPRVHTLVPPDLMNEDADVNFPNTPVEQLLEVYAQYTDRTLLLGGINKQLSLDVVALDGKLKVPELIQAFDIVLNQNQIAVVPIGEKFLLAVPAAQATKEGLPFLDVDAALMPESPTLMTKIVQLEYAEPKDVVNVIQKFAKVAGGITTVESTRMLIIQDYAINLKRMLELIAKIDVSAPANEQIFEVIPIRYAPVKEVADMLGSFTSGGSAFGSARTTGSGTRGSGSSNANRNSTSNVNNRNNSTANRLGNSFRPQQSRPPTPTRVATPGTAASQFQQRLRNIVSTAAGADEPEPLLGNASISYYERNNSLLVRGTREEMEKVRTMVDELDQVQPQVLIEAIIMDVSLTDNYQFGINLLQKQTSLGANSSVAGGVNNGAGSFFSNFAGTNTLGTAISSGAGGFTYYGLLNRNWESVIRAVETDSFATVLSRPQILTTHAEPARLFVGESLPFPSSSGADFTGVSRVSISQVDIGITLDILPLINPDGLVILEIEQTVESFRGFETFGELRAPRTTRREASSKIAVNTGETIILGGMISNNRDSTDTGTPFLRKIPLIKHLFKQNTKNSLRSELILMLRPSVLATPEIAQASTQAAMAKLPGVQRAEMESKIEDALWMKKLEEDKKKLLEKSQEPAKTNKWSLPIDMFEVLQGK
jgi:general secretion pathway protein D